jgi:hypothetical protein
MQLRQWMLALSGNEAISNGITREAERLGLTPQSRARKEREQEQERRVAAAVQAMREETERVMKRLDHLDQASMAALLENEELQRAAREELQRIRESAYEITMPDGSVAKVYRDGDKVRDDAGALVSSDVVKADEVPPAFSTWAERKRWGDALRQTEDSHREIIEYRDRLDSARKRIGGGELSAAELAHVEEDIERMPGAVRRHVETAAPSQRAESGVPGANGDAPPQSGLSSDARPAAPFARAVAGIPAAVARRRDDDLDADLKALPPSVSMNGPR